MGERRKCAGGCGRWLTDPESIARGYGQHCAQRHGIPVHKPRRTPARAAGRTPDTPPDPIPGQEEIPLHPMQPSLWAI